MNIYLIRHGETTGDIEDRYGGCYDDHLTEKGKQQLQDTAKEMVSAHVDTIYSSTLVRAKESANILNVSLNTEIVFLDGLRERSYGILEGLTKMEALEKYPEAVENHKDTKNTDPGGESIDEFRNRVINTFKFIVAQENETIAVISHGGPLKIIMEYLNMPIPEKIGDGEIFQVAII